MVRLCFLVLLSFGLTPQLFARVPPSSHVFLVVEENHGYSTVVGNAALPYFNSLANTYGLATQYYANVHPSMGNYFMLTSGEILSTNDGNSTVFNHDNLVRRIIAGGKTWKVYAESLPSAGYVGADVYPYTRRHNPFVFYSDVVNSSVQGQNLLPFTQFSIDLANGQLPNFSYILPNLHDDAHDCPAGLTTCTDTQKLSAADTWLQTNLSALLKSSFFQAGGDGLLVIVWDESTSSDATHGGGHVATLVIGPKVLQVARPSNFYQHESTLKLILESLGLSTHLSAATLASDMIQFFSSSAPAIPVAVSPTSLFLGYVPVGTTGAAQAFKVTNHQSVSLDISGIKASPDFVASSNCPASLAPASSCTISTNFTPPATGTIRGVVTISDNASSNPQVVYLAGTGVP